MNKILIYLLIGLILFSCANPQPDVEEKITYATMPFYRADSPLKPSGLLGPVRIIAIH